MKHLGRQKPRYLFFYNNYEWFRASKCLKCDKLTALRKFAFLIGIGESALVCFGLTARYCSKCEFIVLHKKDVEAELAVKFGDDPGEIFVVGTVDKKVWKKGLEGEPPTIREMLDNTADFKKILVYEIKPRGWYFEG